MNKDIQVLQEEIRDLRSCVVNDRKSRLHDSLFSPELAPHYGQLAQQLAKSTLIPKSYIGKPMDIYVAMAMGYQLGLPVEQAIQDIAVINGRPCLWGDGLLAVVMQHEDFEDIIEIPIMKDDMVTGYECTIKRKSRTPTVRKFTLEMAKKAGLLGKVGPWTTSTERMLQLRARSFACRDSFPDALRGIKSREEIEDFIEGEVVESHTEKVKKELLSQQGTTNENNTLTNDFFIAEKAVENQERVAVDEFSAPKDETPSRSERCDTLSKLIREKGVTTERLHTALAYYCVDGIEDLSIEKAEHFINLLNKE